jgi:hypothetical protein
MVDPDDGESDEIRIFPLQQVVLFPRVPCALHVFEPRYRQMTEAALAGDGRIGMVTVRPEHTHEMAGDPPIFDVGCEGRIVESQRVEDGRYNLLLMGTQRFRIESEPPRAEGRLYRVARVQPLKETLAEQDVERMGALRRRALELLTTLVERATGGKRRFDPAPFEGDDDIAAANGLCQMLDLDPLEKQGLLEEPRIAERLDRLVALLEFRMAQLASTPSGAERTIH